MRSTGLLFALCVLVLATACSGGSEEPTATAISPAATPTATIVPLDPDNGALHLPIGTYPDFYSVTPATSGSHWIGPVTPFGVPAPARWGIYETALPDVILVHNLEHGGIGLHYDCPDGCDELKSQLEGMVPANPS